MYFVFYIWGKLGPTYQFPDNKQKCKNPLILMFFELGLDKRHF